MEKSTNLKELSISDLVKYEKATEILCKFYENAIKNYDGTVVQHCTEEYEKYKKYNEKYFMILAELEERVGRLSDGKKD